MEVLLSLIAQMFSKDLLNACYMSGNVLRYGATKWVRQHTVNPRQQLRARTWGFLEVSLLWPTSLAWANYFIVFYCFLEILEIREIAYNLISSKLNYSCFGIIIIPNSLPLLSIYQFQNWDHNIYVLLYIDFCLFVLISISI